MPCQGGCQSEAETNYGSVKRYLCALLTAAEKTGNLNQLLKAVCWEEAGVTKAELWAWWEAHKREDAARRVQESADRKRERVAQDAYNKLTPAQRDALGVRAPNRRGY